MRTRKTVPELARPRRGLAKVGAAAPRVRFGVVLAILAVAVAGTLIEAVPASAAAPGITSHTVVTGVVTRDGDPVAQADVLLIAWPNDEVMDALEDGERVNTRVVGRETADSDGQFAVVLDPATLSSEHRRPDGGVQLELVVADAVDEVFWHFTAAASTRVGSAWGNDRIDQRDLAGRSALNLGPAHVLIDIGEQPEARELGDEPETWVDDNGERLTLSSAAQRATAAKETRRALFDVDVAGSGGVIPLGQGWCATSAYKNGLTESFIRTIGVVNAKNWVDQETSSSHTLGIGYKNGSGSWSQSGTSTRSTGATSEDHRGYNATIRNKVNYRMYVGCDGLPLNAQQWRSSSIHSLGSSGTVHSTRPAWNKPANCTTYTQGNKTKTQGTNVTFSSGVSFSPISLSAKSSYSSSTKQRWVVSGRFQLCGSTSAGWAGAPQAGAFVP